MGNISHTFTLSDLIIFLLAALATLRLSVLVAEDEGPFSLFMKLRSLTDQGSWVGRGIRCIYCTSFWIALILALLLVPPGMVLLTWLALAGAAIVLDGFRS